jgi:hypothetical protein
MANFDFLECVLVSLLYISMGLMIFVALVILFMAITGAFV